MSKEASVAPKERVNIVYRPADGDGREDVELPLKMLVMGDFTGSPDGRPVEKREPVAVDRENFNEVMKAQGISLNIAVPNRLSGTADDELPVNLMVESLKDFGPEAIVEQVPEMKRLLELREALRALKGPLSNVPDFRKKIQELITDDAARAKLLAEIGIEA
ncbi:type VI secretion system contractile sheath small subunit [Geobacter pickeringii]|uniref:Type VI secretion protein n=1 Tax=Geobacter pickeringii TaxID=345632 RepID=A0A0B5BCK2_9BACT|nr:type VI secretion system contractile sheath small subunit [Geobacter pickeringii]AJE02300.1 type VI secretion protein [Geobacter pickeringii]